MREDVHTVIAKCGQSLSIFRSRTHPALVLFGSPSMPVPGRTVGACRRSRRPIKSGNIGIIAW
jgi:hypothetical protein